jgi:hypothetical protein
MKEMMVMKMTTCLVQTMNKPQKDKNNLKKNLGIINQLASLLLPLDLTQLKRDLTLVRTTVMVVDSKDVVLIMVTLITAGVHTLNLS